MIGAVSKTVAPLRVPGVRISLSPPICAKMIFDKKFRSNLEDLLDAEQGLKYG